MRKQPRLSPRWHTLNSLIYRVSAVFFISRLFFDVIFMHGVISLVHASCSKQHRLWRCEGDCFYAGIARIAHTRCMHFLLDWSSVRSCESQQCTLILASRDSDRTWWSGIHLRDEKLVEFEHRKFCSLLHSQPVFSCLCILLAEIDCFFSLRCWPNSGKRSYCDLPNGSTPWTRHQPWVIIIVHKEMKQWFRWFSFLGPCTV